MQRIKVLKQILEELPRVKLGCYPTPLMGAPHLSSFLGGPHIFIKREDLSGIALGGNKCRHLEFILGHAKQQGADAIVSTSGSQSNFCTLMAAAARKLGMKPSFVLMKDIHPETQGNLLLHNVMDSDIEIVDVPHEAVFGEEMSKRLDEVASDLREKGYRPFVIRHTFPDISYLLSSVAWVDAADEIVQQLKNQNINAQYIVHATATGGTQAGLVIGSEYLKASYKILGISVWRKKGEAESAIIKRANEVSKFLQLGTNITSSDVEVNEEYIGDGYGIPSEECIDAIKLVAKTEGVFLDPVYTGKAMAGLISLIRGGKFTSKDAVVFIHTGGIPALFAYDREVIR